MRLEMTKHYNIIHRY